MSPAARTKSSCFSDSVIDRITRAVIIQLNSAIIATSAIQPRRRSRGDTTAMIRKLGRTSSRSTTNISARSVQPPKYPAQAPTSDGQHGREHRDQQPDDQRLLQPVQALGEDVLADRVGAPPVRGGRALVQRRVVDVGVGPPASGTGRRRPARTAAPRRPPASAAVRANRRSMMPSRAGRRPDTLRTVGGGTCSGRSSSSGSLSAGPAGRAPRAARRRGTPRTARSPRRTR